MKNQALVNTDTLTSRYRQVRDATRQLCRPLLTDDYQIQSIVQTSPPKWHIAHVSWFFETFILGKYSTGYQVFNPHYDYLFNSYYYTHGSMHPRPQRGLLSRPSVEEVYAYRDYVDSHMLALLQDSDTELHPEFAELTILGINHEQQHQELLLMDIKHNFSVNPLRPAYRSDLPLPQGESRPVNWQAFSGGLYTLGHQGDGFAFDNETPAHAVLMQPYRLADRFVNNVEFQQFIEDGGYSDPALWLADGWSLMQREGWSHPLYWVRKNKQWLQFTLGGLRALNPHEPVCHISYYEADAYARWAGKRLPSESELERQLQELPVSGNFLSSGLLHPQPAGIPGQWFGELWAWTLTPYAAYPGFKPLEGSIGEYNGKFMSNQMVLKGGCCVTPEGHARASYRNFFYPDERWAFTGLRLAEDA